ncbi:MAG: hypothetical protein ABIQ05_08800, partial [Candidatus Limnocylindria bacterium]
MDRCRRSVSSSAEPIVRRPSGFATRSSGRSARRPEAVAGGMGDKDRVWEVFRQEAEGDPMIHGGSVRAPDEELATHYAREF